MAMLDGVGGEIQLYVASIFLFNLKRGSLDSFGPAWVMVWVGRCWK